MTDEPQPQPRAGSTKYFYAVSIKWSVGVTPNYGLLTGVADVYPHENQETVFQYLLAQACEQYNAPADGIALLHYYLARNEL